MSTAAAPVPQAAKVEGDLIFEVDEVTLSFGGLTSLSSVSLNQRRGEILSVIGPNGAGKTCLFNCLTGVYIPQHGSIVFHSVGGNSSTIVGEREGPLAGLGRLNTKPHLVNRLGIARTFQTSRLFSALTAFENVKIGVESRQHTGPIGAMLRLPRTRREEREGDAPSWSCSTSRACACVPMSSPVRSLMATGGASR